jgi:hypothetical protein
VRRRSRTEQDLTRCPLMPQMLRVIPTLSGYELLRPAWRGSAVSAGQAGRKVSYALLFAMRRTAPLTGGLVTAPRTAAGTEVDGIRGQDQRDARDIEPAHGRHHTQKPT